LQQQFAFEINVEHIEKLSS